MRDSRGHSFKLDSQAIEHSKTLAADMRLNGPVKDADLRICVVNEQGHEIHVELVSPNADFPA